MTYTKTPRWTAFLQAISQDHQDDHIRAARFAFGRQMHMACVYVGATTASIQGNAVEPKVASLFHVLAAVEMMRKLKALVGGEKDKEEDARKLRHSCFREYFFLSGLHLRSDMTTKRIVELHLGPQGLVTWEMLQSLGYSPSENDFWVQLDACTKAQEVAPLQDIDSDLFMEMDHA